MTQLLADQAIADLAQSELESCLEAQAQSIAPEFPLVCGQCVHFQPYLHRPTDGYCQIRTGMEWVGDELRKVKLAKASGSLACPSIICDLPF